jgi:hypothetical protein
VCAVLFTTILLYVPLRVITALSVCAAGVYCVGQWICMAVFIYYVTRGLDDDGGVVWTLR